MDLSYTNDQVMIRNMAREFALKELEPQAAARDGYVGKTLLVDRSRRHSIPFKILIPESIHNSGQLAEGRVAYQIFTISKRQRHAPPRILTGGKIYVFR